MVFRTQMAWLEDRWEVFIWIGIPATVPFCCNHGFADVDPFHLHLKKDQGQGVRTYSPFRSQVRIDALASCHLGDCVLPLSPDQSGNCGINPFPGIIHCIL